MSLWHWLALAILLSVPMILIYFAVRAGVRAGMRDSRRNGPDGGKGGY